jgi:hypothetical protein
MLRLIGNPEYDPRGTFFHMKIKHKLVLIALSLTPGIKWQHLETRWLVKAMNHNNFTPIAKYSF